MILTTLLLLLLTGCSQFVYQTHPANYRLSGVVRPVILDHTYTLYVRAVSSEDQPVNGSANIHRQLSLAPKGSAKSGKVMGNQKIVEIEYLWISDDQRSVFYVSTIADRYQNRYSGRSFLGLDRPNAADFRVFLLGKIEPDHSNRLIFYDKNGKQTDTWTIKRDRDELTLVKIEQKHFRDFEAVYEMDKALLNPLRFYLTDGWELRYLPKRDTVIAHQQRMPNDTLWYSRNGKSYELLIPFKNTTLTYPNNHIIYDPK